jgi:hypothetical protein
VYAFAIRALGVLVAGAGATAGIGVGVGGTEAAAGAGVGATPRVTPAADAHRLTQLCGMPCSFAAAQIPFARTVASTASLCSLV